MSSKILPFLSIQRTTMQEKTAQRLPIRHAQDTNIAEKTKIISLFTFILILHAVNGSLQKEFHAVVAQDGSGNFTRIVDAIAAAPNKSTEQYKIKIKAGSYQEYVYIGIGKTNIALIGDGMDNTIITGNRSNGTGWHTFNSATVAIDGDEFTAKDITFANTAGPHQGQAVAMRSKSKFSAFYRCWFLGFQDTLYIHSGIQFYRECEIWGTVDFIFGDAAAVFQTCSIYARKPIPGQANTVTAQGREDNITQSGISIHNCTIRPAADLAATHGVQTYLGRPWKNFSRTVVMQSALDSLIDPAGWLQWNNDSTLLDSIYYREYNNTGPGADTSRRVRWRGVAVINSSSEAMAFTVRRFINGTTWLPSRGIPFSPDLI